MNSFSLVEKVNPNKILELLASPLLDKDHAERLAAYYRIAKKHNGCIPVTYVKRDSGRYFPENGYPLYGVYQWRAVRAELFRDDENDIDAMVCHPTIMCYLADKFDINCDMLKHYISNRPMFIDDLDINSDDLDNYNNKEHSDWSLKDMCKFVFTSSMFGCSLKTIIKKLHMKRSPVKEGSMSDKLLSEIKNISKTLGRLECYKHLKQGIKNCHDGKVVSRIISNIESEVVTELIKLFQKHNLECTIYMYDGFQVRGGDEEVIDTLLTDFNKNNDYGLTFIRKPFSKKVSELQNCAGRSFEPARTQKEVDALMNRVLTNVPEGAAKMFQFSDGFPEGIQTRSYSERYVQPFSEGKKVAIVHSDLGTGKSYQVKALHQKEQPESAIFLTPRRIFAKSMKHGLGENWSLYLDKTAKKVLCDQFLICQINSLHKVGRSYDYVYVDEIESCLEMLSADIISKKRRDVIEQVEELFKNAKRIVLCDADISMRTLDFILGLGIKPEEICYEHNTMVTREKNAIQVPNDETLIWHFDDLLSKGKNVVFFSASKSFLNKQIIPIIEKHQLQEDDYLIYTPDTKLAISDVEDEWKGKRVVAYTPTITVGVDFNIPNYFDTVLVYAQNFGCGGVRQIFQAIHRVRKIKMEHIIYSIHPKAEPSHRYPFKDYEGAVDYVNTCTELRELRENNISAPEWFKRVHIWNILESALSKNLYVEMFDYFLSRYGYHKKTTELKDMSKEENSQEEEGASSEVMDFDKIEDIDFEQYMEFEQLLRRGELDAEQKLQFYKARFIHDYPKINKQFFPMILSSRGRRILKRVNWEINDIDPETLLTAQMEHDYLETVNLDSILLNKVKAINDLLGIRHSADDGEIPLSKFSNPKVLEHLGDVAKLMSLGKGEKDVTNVGYFFKFWNGCSIEPVRSMGGKGIKRVRINGRREGVYQIVGLEGLDR